MIKQSQRQSGAVSDPRWTAIAERDHTAAGRFLYGVTTTGIYCKPGCSSRKPRRQNVRFFLSRAEAERAGFRPCRRCRPDLNVVSDGGGEAVARARELLDQTEEPLSLTELATAVGLSPSHLHRRFSREVGMSPKAYAAALRLRRLQAELRDGQTVTRAIYAAGFGSSSRFYGGDAQALGMPPTTYRAGGDGVEIHYAVHRSPHGPMLVATTDKGLCAVEFGDADQE
ncbi:MAG TPA: bifunctional transcriptional activator/DNA repair enzyme AdaA, partial [Thermomicrobiales bacterium]|nr:bifunctional transcriptional activator/DNA repair enzyme AdaA [Thermomicrobiales bacterium]